MADLHCVALIETDKKIRESLALVLTSTGGMRVVCFTSINGYMGCQQDNTDIQLVLLPVGIVTSTPPELDHPLCYYGQSRGEIPSSIPFIPLLADRLAAFPEQLRQYYHQLISQE